MEDECKKYFKTIIGIFDDNIMENEILDLAIEDTKSINTFFLNPKNFNEKRERLAFEVRVKVFYNIELLKIKRPLNYMESIINYDNYKRNKLRYLNPKETIYTTYRRKYNFLFEEIIQSSHEVYRYPQV